MKYPYCFFTGFGLGHRDSSLESVGPINKSRSFGQAGTQTEVNQHEHRSLAHVVAGFGALGIHGLIDDQVDAVVKFNLADNLGLA